MSRPVLFVIDDDAGVVHALRDDLGRRFGKDFRVIAESSAEIVSQRVHHPGVVVDHEQHGS
jgi:hypothetical protein